MKILFLTNNENTYSLVEFLEQKEDVIVIDKRITMLDIKKYRPEFIISYNYRFIISHEIITYMSGKMINLHISLLPWNKGSYPNIWSIVDDTPKGVTIHTITQGIDEGDILVQQLVAIDEEKDTLESSYKKLHEAMKTLFIDHWDNIKLNQVVPVSQNGEGSKHTIADTKEYLDLIDNWGMSVKAFKQRVSIKNNKE